MCKNNSIIGSIAGVDIHYHSSYIIGLIGLVGLFTIIIHRWSEELWLSIMLGIGLATIHTISILIHHFGHLVASRKTGYPMTGICFCIVFALSLYPQDEPELPATLHAIRAIGGPSASFVSSGLLVVLLAIMPDKTGLSYRFIQVIFWDMFLFFTLGSLIPMKINDGATLLNIYRGR